MPQTPCPYCGQPHDSSDVGRCSHCNGLFEPLSQTATQLAMGPWFVRDEDRPFMPGFNEAILRQQVVTGRITANTILRGPTTNQFWMNAADTPGVSRLMGTCHSCHQAVEPTDTTCNFCKSDMSLPDDVDALGLKFVTDEQRAEAQKQIAEGRAAQPAPKPTAKPAAKPVKPKPTQAAAPIASKPAATQPTPTPAPPPAPEPEPLVNDGNELTNELAEDVWHAGPAPGARRRKRNKGSDQLAIGMAVTLFCVIAIGILILLTSGGGTSEEDEEEQVVEQVEPERDIVSVSRISVPALVVYERLDPEEIPAEFEDRFAEVRRLKEQADADKEAERFNEAYDGYKRLGELITPLENDLDAWRTEQAAKEDATAVRDRIARLRQQAQDAEAEKWAAKQWQAAQSGFEEADRLFAAGEFVQASERFTEAESSYLAAENQALAGQVAAKARQTLLDAMKAGGSEQGLRKFANQQMERMLQQRAAADGFLNDQEYAKAEQSYNNALDALKEAQDIVELSRYKKYYAFEAGFQASALMLSAARGDGVTSEAQRALATLFDRLRILPNPAAGITPGDEVGFTVAIQPLVNDARDKLIAQHGEDVQACYLIGFHASIIDQTLKTISLTDDQQKRIHQSLGKMESAAVKAGWDNTKLRPIIDQVRTANRNAKLKAAPDATRIAWKKLVGPMQSKATAPALMNPSDSSNELEDPELFPNNG